MHNHLRGLPQQCRLAWTEANSLPLPADYSEIDKIVVLGMGGSAIGGDLARALASSRSRVTLVSHRDYGIPAFVDDRTLVIASSYSGTTEETLDGFQRALAVKCKKIAITTGGKLKDLADEHGIPAFVFDYRSPPRAAVGYSLMPILAVLQKLAVLPDISEEVDSALSSMQAVCSRVDTHVPESDNVAKNLAACLCGRLPVIYGAGVLSPVAYRWKTQLNENGKTWAISETMPELCHNSVAGLALPDKLKEKAYVLMLQAPAMHVRYQARYAIVGEVLDKSGIPHRIVSAEGGSELGQVLGLVMLGDWTSYYLAILNGVDPTPIPSIDYLKDRLSRF